PSRRRTGGEPSRRPAAGTRGGCASAGGSRTSRPRLRTLGPRKPGEKASQLRVALRVLLGLVVRDEEIRLLALPERVAVGPFFGGVRASVRSHDDGAPSPRLDVLREAAVPALEREGIPLPANPSHRPGAHRVAPDEEGIRSQVRRRK